MTSLDKKAHRHIHASHDHGRALPPVYPLLALPSAARQAPPQHIEQKTSKAMVVVVGVAAVHNTQGLASRGRHHDPAPLLATLTQTARVWVGGCVWV
eukprot:m.81318 g.81318  ORF g.81318 m.81318 type:complete len:97 (+) comp13362_c1_seq1:391-681(+)